MPPQSIDMTSLEASEEPIQDLSYEKEISEDVASDTSSTAENDNSEDEEEGESKEEEVEEEINEYDLLAMAKKRMAAELDSKPKESSQQTAEEKVQEEEEVETQDNDPKDPPSKSISRPPPPPPVLPAPPSPQQSGRVSPPRTDDSASSRNRKFFSGAAVGGSARRLLPGRGGGGDSSGLLSPRARRKENVELWALLRQSQTRVEETKELVEQLEKEGFKDDDEEEDAAVDAADDKSEASLEASDLMKDKPDISTMPIPEDRAKSDDDASEGSLEVSAVEVEETDQISEEQQKQRDFQKENAELWELLVQSKRRLEEAEKAKKEAAAIASGTVKKKTAKVENPYAELDVVPDEPTKGDDDEALTQKELLLAMAVAEEAARSGKDTYVTPDRQELRQKDIKSFDFVKKKEEKKAEGQPRTSQTKPRRRQDPPVSFHGSFQGSFTNWGGGWRQSMSQETPRAPAPIKDDTDFQQEQSRFKALSGALTDRWKSFKHRASNIDHVHRQRLAAETAKSLSMSMNMNMNMNMKM